MMTLNILTRMTSKVTSREVMMTSLLTRILLRVAPTGILASHVPEERAAQIAAHKALKRAKEEQLTYLSSSAAKKRSKQFFAKKWEEYKRLEAALNSLGCGTRS